MRERLGIPRAQAKPFAQPQLLPQQAETGSVLTPILHNETGRLPAVVCFAVMGCSFPYQGYPNTGSRYDQKKTCTQHARALTLFVTE